MSDIVNELRDRAYASKIVDRLCERAADEIARLRGRARFADAVIRSGDVAALTDEEREAVEWVIFQQATPQSIAVTIRRLLERLSPPAT
jgi:hypothetical protein